MQAEHIKAHQLRPPSDTIKEPSSRALSLLESKHGQPTLREQMGISPDKFRVFTRIVRDSARRHLDCTKQIQHQVTKALGKHRHRVVKHWNEAPAYENHWPIGHYTMVYLKWCVSSTRRKRGSSTLLHFKENLPIRADTETPTISGPVDACPFRREASAYVGKRLARLNRDISTTEKPLATSMHESGTKSYSVPLSQRHATGSSRIDTTSSVSHRPGSSQEPVAEFIQSIGLPQAEFLPMLQEVGVRDASRLAALAMLEDCDQWIDKHLKLSPIDFKVLTTGLAKLANNLQK